MGDWLERSMNRVLAQQEEQERLAEEKRRLAEEEKRRVEEQERLAAFDKKTRILEANKPLIDLLKSLDAEKVLEDIRSIVWNGLGDIIVDDPSSIEGRVGIALSFEFPRYIPEHTEYITRSSIFEDPRSTISESITWDRTTLAIQLKDEPNPDTHKTTRLSLSSTSIESVTEIIDTSSSGLIRGKEAITDFVALDTLRKRNLHKTPMELARSAFWGITTSTHLGTSEPQKNRAKIRNFVDKYPQLGLVLKDKEFTPTEERADPADYW